MSPVFSPLRAVSTLPAFSVLSVLCASLLLSGCAGLAGPVRVAAPEPTVAPLAFKEDALWKRANAAPAAPVSDAWWQVYQDATLNQLQAQLVIGNENLKAAVAQVAAARAVLAGSEAAQSPTLAAGLSASRADSSSANNQAANSYGASLNAGWELDLWGRLSEATRGNQARLAASEADLAAARLSAQATLTQTYFALRGAEAQQALIERSITAYARSLELTQVRQQAGVVAASDVLQARTQLQSARVQAIEANNQRAVAEHAIAVLLGQPPSALTLAAAAVQPALPAAVALPPLLPSSVLQRRPDIRAAEQRQAAAYAQIGVAEAGFFPSLTLSASAGLRNGNLGDLFSAPSLVWSVGPALAQKLFDGGATRAASHQARATAEQASATYRQTVLTAFQEVEDNLLLADRLQSELGLQTEALQNAQRVLDIVQEQYRVGTVSYLNVVTAQATALTAERTVLDLRTRQLNASSQLLKNIAGRW